MAEKINIPVSFTQRSLAQKVCMLVHSDGLKYSEALLEVCEEHEIDPHDIAKLVKGPLKAKLEAEAMRYNNIPNTNGNSLYWDVIPTWLGVSVIQYHTILEMIIMQ